MRAPRMAGTVGTATIPWPAFLVGLWAVAAAARLALLDGPLYAEEAAHYAVARGWGADPDNVFPTYRLNEALWWQRPLFSLLLAPGAALGVEAYRIEHALLAALLPASVAAVAHKAGTGRLLAVGAGLAVALHPFFVLWGSRAFPDSIMAVLVLAGLLAHQSRRPVAAAAFLLAAMWVKETALLALVALLAWTVWHGRRRGEVRAWPLELDRPSTALLATALLAPLPMAYAVLRLGGRLPVATGPFGLDEAAGLFLTAWLLLPVIAGLAWDRSRPYSLAALAYAGAHAGAAVLDRGPAASDLVLPASLAVLASAVALRGALHQARPAMRAGAQVAGATLAVAMLVLVAVPDTVAAKAWASPGAAPPASLAQLGRQLRGDDLTDAVAAIRDDQWERVFLVDVAWSNLDHPFAERAGTVGWAVTWISVPLAEWVQAIEGSDVTVLRKEDRPLSHALREAYADCVQHDGPAYVVIDGGPCPGRGDRLGAAYDRHRAAAA